MLMFVEYMRERGSRQAKNAGKQLKAATIGAYESAIRTFRSRSGAHGGGGGGGGTTATRVEADGGKGRPAGLAQAEPR
eukprot:5919989-Pleurochrysis_carterae.AAC.1